MFVAKLNDCEGEAAETQTWLDFAVECQYLDSETGQRLSSTYDGEREEKTLATYHKLTLGNSVILNKLRDNQ